MRFIISPWFIKSCRFHTCSPSFNYINGYSVTNPYSCPRLFMYTRVPTWSRARGGHIVDEVLQRCSNSNERMVQGGVLFIGHPVVVVMVGPSSPSCQAPVAVANIKCYNKQQAEQAHWAGNHCCEGHRAQRRRLFCGDCRKERTQRVNYNL